MVMLLVIIFSFPIAADSWRCTNSSECVPLSFKCDGTRDCPDGSDEKDCTGTCESWQFAVSYINV